MAPQQHSSMTYRQLGKSDLHISRIGFGCMSLEPGQTDIRQLVDAAVAQGINFFDTADLYDKGLNETNLGHALKDNRKKVIIATKVGNQLRPDGTGWNWNPRKNYILSAVEESLKRLQTDYIDLYQLHGGTIEDPIDETISAFEQLKQEGKIRYYGISSIRPNVIREYVQKSNIVSVMMQYSLLDRRPEEECLSLLREHTIGVLARGSVAGGLLAGKPVKPYLSYSQEEVKKAAEAIQAATGPQQTTSATAIRYVLQNSAISSAIVGIRTTKHLTDAIAAITEPLLSAAQLDTLNQTLRPEQYLQHR